MNGAVVISFFDGRLHVERVLYVLLNAECLETGYVSSTAFLFVHRCRIFE